MSRRHRWRAPTTATTSSTPSRCSLTSPSAWAAWLVELHRILAPRGLLIASFLGEGMSQVIAGEPWNPERIGMNVLNAHYGWDIGGPSVLMSP